MQNIAGMMDDIYMERFMKGKDDANFKNKIKNFRNVRIIDYNKHNANVTKNFDDDALENKEDNSIKNQVDFRDILFIKSPLIEETVLNN